MNEGDVAALERFAAVIVLVCSAWLWPSGIAAARNLYSMLRYGKPIQEPPSYFG